MASITFTRVAGIRPLVAFLRNLGAPVHRLADSAGLRHLVEADLEHPVPMHQACKLYAAASRTQGIQSIGALIGERLPVQDLGLYGAALVRASSVGGVFRANVRLLPRFASGYRAEFVADGDFHWYRLRVVGGGAGAHHAEELSLTQTLAVLEVPAGPTWRPPLVRVPFSWRHSVQRLERLARTRVEAIGEHVAIPVPRWLLPQPMFPHIGAQGAEVETSFEKTAHPLAVEGAVRLLLRSLPPGRLPTLSATAAAAGVHPRALQRAISDTGNTFSQLVQESLAERASALLADSSRTVTEVGFELGYADAANFTRAFRGWFGVSPVGYRLSRAP